MIDSPCAINPAFDMFKQLETCLRPYYPDMTDQRVIDDEFDAEETAHHMPFFFPTLGPMVVKSETPSLKLKPQVLGCLEKIGSSVELEDLGHVDS